MASQGFVTAQEVALLVGIDMRPEEVQSVLMALVYDGRLVAVKKEGVVEQQRRVRRGVREEDKHDEEAQDVVY